ARGAVGLHGIGAHTRRGVAGADVVALVLRHAHDGVRSDARSRLARVRVGARALVVARRSVGLGRVRAEAARGIAKTRDVTLVEDQANDGHGTHARPRLARVDLRARIAIVATGTIGLGRVRARPVGGIARARVVALVLCNADHGVRSDAAA